MKERRRGGREKESSRGLEEGLDDDVNAAVGGRDTKKQPQNDGGSATLGCSAASVLLLIDASAATTAT